MAQLTNFKKNRQSQTKGTCKTHSNTQEQALSKRSQQPRAFDCFRKKIRPRCLTGFWINAKTEIIQLQPGITRMRRFTLIIVIADYLESKLQSCLMMDAASFFNLSLIESLLTQNDNIWFVAHSFLHLDHNFL